MDVACPQCGLLSPSDHRFCGYCGASLEPAEATQEVLTSSGTAPTEVKAAMSESPPQRRVSGLGCGLIGGLALGAVIFVQNVYRAGFVSVEAVASLVFHVCFYGCIAAAIGYGIAREWKKARRSLLAAVLFLALLLACGVGLLLLPSL